MTIGNRRSSLKGVILSKSRGGEWSLGRHFLGGNLGGSCMVVFGGFLPEGQVTMKVNIN